MADENAPPPEAAPPVGNEGNSEEPAVAPAAPEAVSAEPSGAEGFDPADDARDAALHAALHGDTNETPREPDPEMDRVVDRQLLCIETLMEGHVQSFIDFFYITHGPENDPEEGEGAVDSNAPEKLQFVKEHLVQAESSRRKGDTAKVHQAYHSLAVRFEKGEDYKTSIFFYEKCLEISKLTGDISNEGLANMNLGRCNEAILDTTAAIKYYETYLDLSTASQAPEEVSNANELLVAAYGRFAEECEQKGDFQEAVVFFEKCLESSRQCKDTQAIGLSNYNLGRMHSKLGDSPKAIQHFNRYLDICKEVADQIGQGVACSALAKEYQSTGDIDNAVRFLELHLDISQQTKQPSSEAEACHSLGVIYSQMKEYGKAVQYFERQFEIARQIGNKDIISQARTNLGIARGNLQSTPFFEMVSGDLNSLLRWKNRRIMTC